jgi:ABC-type multidrug transport system fused ATPase/permease subunit
VIGPGKPSSSAKSKSNSAERIEYYSTQVEQEQADVIGPGKPSSSAKSKSRGSSDATKPLRKLADAPTNWPSAGAIEISGLSMRYRKDTPLALHGVSLSIRAGARVGVVGRTGSGKSSLLLSLLRIVEPERDAQGRGPIKIDGVDTASIALKTLRSAISVLPQNPVILSGTVRSNLDPFGLLSDEQINEALRKVELAGKVSVMSDVAEYGENLSQGERQLLIMAKATLSKSRTYRPLRRGVQQPRLGHRRACPAHDPRVVHGQHPHQQRKLRNSRAWTSAITTSAMKAPGRSRR